MAPLYLLVLAFAAATVSAQVCPPFEAMFVLDQSENAARASSSDDENRNYDILRSALTSFLTYPAVVAAGINAKVGIYSYSSSSNQVVVASPGSTPAAANNNLTRIGLDRATGGGSWTYTGLSQITTGPTENNNRIIIISSQGSGNTNRRALAQTEINRLLALGWIPYVIAVQGVNPIDYVELRIVNNGVEPPTLADPAPTDKLNPKGYKSLSTALINFLENVLCKTDSGTPTPTPTPTTTTAKPGTPTPSPVTPAPQTPTPAPATVAPPATPSPPGPTTRKPDNPVPTLPSGTGPCTQCLYNGGFGFDYDTVNCDGFFICMPDSTPIQKYCGSGTFFDGTSCNYINDVKCEQAPCDSSIANGTKYHSGRCCNKYFECNGGKLVEKACPLGSIFDDATASCQAVTNRTSMCEARGRFYCDVNPSGPVGSDKCDGYSPDPYGDPCYFMFAKQRMMVPSGTEWSQDLCSLRQNLKNVCWQASLTNDTYFPGTTPSEECTPVFLADFNGGKKTAYSERLDMTLNVHSIVQEVQLSNDALVFTKDMENPFFYYYYFNNRQFRPNTAFMVDFRLDDPTVGQTYDILSNNYCSLCPETIGMNVAAASGNRRTVTITFKPNVGVEVQTTAVITKQNAGEVLRVIIIWGETQVYGQLVALTAAGGAREVVDFEPVDKEAGASIAINRCGIQFGRGSYNNFVGTIDNFAVYEYCSNIDVVLM